MGLVKIDKKEHPFCYSGHQYALDVVSGKIPNSRYVVGACKRFLEDLEKGKYPFDVEYAERFLRLVQNFDHVIGNWKTKNILYLPWQNFVLMCIMGFKNPETGFRRFRSAHVEIPRGQGKSTLASQIGLFFLGMDNPKGNTISCFATKNEQARIVLDSSRAMAKGNPSFLSKFGVKVLAHKIIQAESNSAMRAMSSDSKSLDGLADILAIIDELHSITQDLFDVVSSGMSKRSDSLLLCITTAGTNVEGVGYSQSTYAKKVALGEIEDDQYFSIVYCAEEGDDLFSEETWKKANPSYGHSVDPITFRAKALKAQEIPADLKNFKIKHLNMWVQEYSAFFDVAKWEVCGNVAADINNFKGKQVRIGVDIASHIDLTSLGYIFKQDGKYYIFDRTYLPEETVKRVKSTIYENCIGQGHLIQTKGEALDQEILRDQILKDAKDFKIEDILLDPWNAVALIQFLQNKGMNVTDFRMNVANLSEPTKRLDALIRQGKIVHNGSPLLKWCLGNVVVKYDAADNVFPRKTHEKLKIDPIIALTMALASHIQDELKINNIENIGIRFL